MNQPIIDRSDPHPRTTQATLSSGWEVSLVVDDDHHLNLYITNHDESDLVEIETGQGDGTQGEQLAFRVTTLQIEAIYHQSIE